MQLKKIIFVSEENTFTSPVAAAILRDKLESTGIEVSSRGMVVLFPEPANPKGIAIAKGRGIDMESHRARLIDAEMFGIDVLILTMTEKIKTELYEEFNDAVNVFALKEYIGEDGDVVTPYGKGMKEYGEVYQEIEELVQIVYERVKALA